MDENKTKKYLTAEVKFIVGISTFIIGILTPYFLIKTDISLIQKDISIINSNHETHIQDIIKNLEKIKEDEVNIEKDLTRTNQILIDHLEK